MHQSSCSAVSPLRETQESPFPQLDPWEVHASIVAMHINSVGFSSHLNWQQIEIKQDRIFLCKFPVVSLVFGVHVLASGWDDSKT